MKRFALLLLLCLGAAVIARGGDLTDAAKDAKTKRAKKGTTKVITNADVKKSKGKIQTTTVPDTPVTPEPSMMEKYQAERAAKLVADAKLAEVVKRVADLEKELAAIEQSYYEENDLTKRDTVIVKRFDEVKAKLDAAKAEWSAAVSAAGPQASAPAPVGGGETPPSQPAGTPALQPPRTWNAAVPAAGPQASTPATPALQRP